MASFAVVAGLAAAVQAVAPSLQPEATVGTVVVETQVPVRGDLRKGSLAFQPSYFAPVRPATAMDMVQWLPGFSFQDTREARGLASAGGNVLIDGKPPTSKTDTLRSVLLRIPAEQVDRIDLIVGGAPGIDMRGWPVIANIVLKQSGERRYLLGFASYLDRKGRAAPQVLFTFSRQVRDRKADLSLDVGRNIAIFPSYGEGSWVRRGRDGGVLFVADADVHLTGPYAIATGGYEQAFARGRLRLNGSARYFETNIDEQDRLLSGPGEFGFTDDQAYFQAEAGVRYDRTFGRWSLETQALERLTHHTTEDVSSRPPLPSTFDERNGQNETVVRTTLRFMKDETFTATASAEGALNGMTAHNVRTLDGLPVVLPAADVDVHERRAEVGGAVTWKPGSGISLDGALKLEASALTGDADGRIERRFAYLKPRAVLTWSPAKDAQVRLRVEREVQQVDFFSFASQSERASGQVRAGNPTLKPQRNWTTELVLERRFWATGDLSLTLRHMDLVDVVDVVPVATADGVIGVIANIGKGRQDDVAIDLTLPLKRLGLGGTLLKVKTTLSSFNVRDPVSGFDRRLSNKYEVFSELHLVRDFPRWNLSAGLDFVYRSPLTLFRPLGNEETAGWSKAAVFVEYRPRPNLTLRAQLDNIPGRRIHQTIKAFASLRDRSPLLYIDDKRLGQGPMLFLRARRTFQ